MLVVWHLRCFGVPALVAPDGTTLALKRNDAAWLAYVALNAGASSLRLATLVWPRTTEKGALNSLRQRVHRLRQATGLRLVEMAQTIGLAADLRLEERVTAAAMDNDPAAWDAEWLAGSSFDAESELAVWLSNTRTAFDDKRREALAHIAAAAEREGELAKALRYAQRLLADDVLSEHAHRRLMRLHYLRGDRAAALAAFDQCERVLKDELGVKPGAETLVLLKTLEDAAALSPSLPTPAAPTPVSLLRPPRTVGRGACAQQLAQAHGLGEIPVLVGEAGMGKTRLLQDFVAARPQALYVQARPSDAAVPYGALARLLRAMVAVEPTALTDDGRKRLACIVPEFDPKATDAAAPQQPAQLQAAIKTMLLHAAAKGRATLVMDDLHFADRASVEMLRSLTDEPLGAAGAVQPRWVFAHRPVEAADEDAALLRAFADAPQVRWIRLPPLQPAQVAELLASLQLPADTADLVPALVRHAGGNPLYVIETLRAMVGARQSGAALPQPANVAHLIDRRLERLSKPALALARVAAIAVPDFSIELAVHALATPALALADAWRELEAADVLSGEGFAHDLVRDAVLRTTPEAIARHAHQLVAAFLAGREVEPARVAGHWWAAGRAREAGEAFMRAAERAARAARFREQTALLDRAAKAWDQAGEAGTARAAREAAAGTAMQGEGTAAALVRIDELLASDDGARSQAQAWALRSNVLQFAGRSSEAEDAARRAFALTPADDLAAKVTAACQIAGALSLRGAPLEALATLEPWAEHVDAVSDDKGRGTYWATLAGLLAQADRPVEARRAAERSLQMAERVGDIPDQMSSLMSLSILDLRLGDLDQALAHARRIETLGEQSPEGALMLAFNSLNMAMMQAARGRYREALERLHAVIAAAGPASAPSRLRASAENFLAMIWLTLGQTARAHRIVDGELDGLDATVRVRRMLLRGATRRAMGQNGLPFVEEALVLCSRQGVADQRIGAMLERLQYLPADGEAADTCAVLAQQAEERGFMTLAAWAVSLRLPRLQAAGRLKEMAAEVAAAERMARTYRGHVAYLPGLLYRCGMAYGALSQMDAAQRCLRDALRWIDHEALPHIAPEHAESFLHRNEANPSLRRAAAQFKVTITGA